MSVAPETFLQELVGSGMPLVGRESLAEGGDSKLAETVLEVDRLRRSEMAYQPPGLHLPAATWATQQLYSACQFLTYRDFDEAVIRRALRRQIGVPVTPSVCYSVDLCFCYLPDVAAVAKGLAPDDPLVEELQRLAHEWPLSSVGMKGVDDVEVSGFIGDRSLRWLYVDRIIERRHVERARPDVVREAIRAAAGSRTHLSPQFDRVLKPGTETT